MLRTLAATAALLLAAPLASAQQASVEPTDAQRCLTLAAGVDAAAAGAPVYPLEAFKRAQKGRVTATLAFDAPDRRPSVEITLSQGDGDGEAEVAFVAAVKDYVRHLRVPCLAPGSTARFALDFVFRPDDARVATTAPLDERAQSVRRMVACVRYPWGPAGPSYPMLAAQRGEQGRVIARLRFHAADQPPTMQTFARRSATRLRLHVESIATGIRMPCHRGEPVEYDLTFFYLLEGHPYGFLPNVTFPMLASMMSKEHLAAIPRDTRAMDCPFDVSLQYRKPDMPTNLVEQLGSFNAARQPVITWLEAAEFNLSRDRSDSIFGDVVRFSIPCIKP